MTRPAILIDGDTLKLEEIPRSRRHEATVELAPEAAARVERVARAGR